MVPRTPESERAKIEIRPPTAYESGLVAEVLRRAFVPVRQIYHPLAEAVAAQEADRNRYFCLVALSQKRIVGSVSYEFVDSALFLFALGVNPEFQKMGIARRFIQELGSYARKAGLRRLALATVVQTGNIPIFQKLGFHVTKTRPAVLFESPSGLILTEALMEAPVN